MGYKDDDIEFANRLLTRREELNDEEVTAWLKEKNHVELLDEIAAIRQSCPDKAMERMVKKNSCIWRRVFMIRRVAG